MTNTQGEIIQCERELKDLCNEAEQLLEEIADTLEVKVSGIRKQGEDLELFDDSQWKLEIGNLPAKMGNSNPGAKSIFQIGVFAGLMSYNNQILSSTIGMFNAKMVTLNNILVEHRQLLRKYIRLSYQQIEEGFDDDGKTSS